MFIYPSFSEANFYLQAGSCKKPFPPVVWMKSVAENWEKMIKNSWNQIGQRSLLFLQKGFSTNSNASSSSSLRSFLLNLTQYAVSEGEAICSFNEVTVSHQVYIVALQGFFSCHILEFWESFALSWCFRNKLSLDVMSLQCKVYTHNHFKLLRLHLALE